MRRIAPTVLLLTIAILVLGVLDVVSGPEVGFALFYLAPIAYAAMRVGLAPALVIAVEAYVAWFAADAITRPDYPIAASIWNALTRLVIFAGTAALVATLARDRDELRALAERRQEFTQLLGSDLRVLSASMLAPDTAGAVPADIGEILQMALATTDSGRVDLASGAPEATIRADRERVNHALVAVLSSALRRTRGDVWLAARDHDERVGIEVTARGDGWITNADEDPDLLIARLVAHLYHGHLSVRAGDAGTTVTLAFPRG